MQLIGCSYQQLSKEHMKIRLLSDLHLEFQVLPIRQGGEDVVVLAGDIGVGISGIEWARKTFSCPVIYVAGNHEFYGQHFDDLIPELRAAAAGSNVRFLENDAVLVDGVRFIGASLWTDYELDCTPSYSMGFAQEVMSDFKVILDGPQEALVKLTPERTVERFHDSLAAITQLVEQPFSGKTVVVTHHLPSPACVDPRFKGDKCNAAFASNLDAFIEQHPQIGYWMHGHTHACVDVMVGATRLLCNPGGYPHGGKRENRNFEQECVISL